MLQAVLIFVDDDFQSPIYASPERGDLDPDLWHEVCEAVNDALEGEVAPAGSRLGDGHRLGWRVLLKSGVSFVAVVHEDIKRKSLEGYLKALSVRYLAEVDNLRRPERDGVEDVVVDVIPDWEDDDE